MAPLTDEINGEDPAQRVKDTIVGYKAGRFLPLVSRPLSANTFISLKLSYRSAIFNLQQQDINKTQSATKQWVTQGMLLKPPELLLHRNPEEGGLGLVHAGARCKANLITCFVDQDHPGSRFSNSYLNSLFRCYVTLEMPLDLIKGPPFFAGDFFPIIKETWHVYDGHILGISTRQWKNIILEGGITHLTD